MQLYFKDKKFIKKIKISLNINFAPMLNIVVLNEENRLTLNV